MKKCLIKSCGLVAVLSFGCSVLSFGADVVNKSCKAPSQAMKKGQPLVQEVNLPKMENPMERQLAYTSGNGTLTLAELLKEKKAVLLDFYATWCGPCMRELPQLQEKSRILKPHGIDVVGINVDMNDLTKAEKMRKERGIDFHWVMDQGAYSDHFKVEGIPTMVLLSQTGEVLFNGHPQDDKLKEALKKLGVSL